MSLTFSDSAFSLINFFLFIALLSDQLTFYDVLRCLKVPTWRWLTQRRLHNFRWLLSSLKTKLSLDSSIDIVSCSCNSKSWRLCYSTFRNSLDCFHLRKKYQLNVVKERKIIENLIIIVNSFLFNIIQINHDVIVINKS